MIRLYLDEVKGGYDYILIDGMHSLGMITINALVAADRVLIPVETAQSCGCSRKTIDNRRKRILKELNGKLKEMGIMNGCF